MPWEVEQLPASEFDDLVEYICVLNDEAEERQEEARTNAGRGAMKARGKARTQGR